jgi:hypothetical protein
MLVVVGDDELTVRRLVRDQDVGFRMKTGS